MATLPGTPETRPTEAPDVDALFPAKSVDELFPAAVERERYRRQTLGTSPIQDLIFGNSEINPVARVLDAFGQGAKHAWGANSSERISKEAEDALKINKQFDNWNEGQNSIIKAANEALFRPAAVQLTKEFHDAEALFRGAAAAFAGTQAAVAQIGEEVGQPKIGREAAAAFEALPTGFRAPTGVPHAPPHPMLAEIRNINSEIAKARELGVIGAGEEGYFGTRPAEVTPPISTPQEAAKPAGMPVDLFVEPRAAEAPKPETAPEVRPAATPEATPAPEAPGIATDVAGKLIAAGRPAEEANASAQIIASHYQARAERFNGELGTAEELYRAEGADIRGGDGKPPVKSEPIRPAPESDVGAVEPAPKPLPGDAGAAEPIKTIPELKTALRGRAAADPQTWSLYEFLASEGGLKPTADLKSIFGGKNPFIPGFGPLLRKGGLTMDEALTRAKENSYVLDPNDIQHVPGAANKGELTRTANDLQDMVAEESRGRKNYRTSHTPKDKEINLDEERGSIVSALHSEIETATGQRAHIDPAIEDRVVEIIQKEGGTDVHSAFERAILEDHDRHEALLNERRSTHGEIAGHDHVGGPASRAGQEPAGDGGHPWASEQEARASNVAASRDHGANDRSAAEYELNQTKRGSSSLNDTASWIIRNKETKEVVMETFDRKKVDALNTEKYEAVPIGEYLGSLNKTGKTAEVEYFQHSHLTDEEKRAKFEAHVAESKARMDAARGLVDDALSKERPKLVLENGDRKLLLSAGATEYPYRITSFDEQGPVGHRDYGINENDRNQMAGEVASALRGGFKIKDATDAQAKFEKGVEGKPQQLIPGVEPITDRERIQALANKPMRGGDLPPGGLFGESSKQFDLFQIKRGKINLREDAKPVITLFKDANASTFIHETGHQWLEELMGDAKHPKAPLDLKNDASAVLNWLGVKAEKAPPPKPGMIRFYHGTAYEDASGFTGKTFVTPHEQYARDYHGGSNNVLYTDFTKAEADARGLIDEVNRYPINGPIDDGAARLRPLERAGEIKTSHHEKFARGFERYMMEGKAPTQALAGVFEKFKDWLTRIYQTVTRLKSPINDEIRGVFDRLVSLRKEDVKIEPEGPPKTFADIHEADAAHTAPGGRPSRGRDNPGGT
jgi:hypothetical protein